MPTQRSDKSSETITLVQVTTIPMTLEFFLKGQIAYLKNQGFEVIAVSSPGDGLDRVAQRDQVAVHAIPMVRGISPYKDLVSLVRLVRLFRRIEPTIVHASTGKAGPLAMLAAVLSRVPVKFYSLRGVMIDRRSGFSQTMLKILERLTCLCADRVLAVSRSVADVIVQGRYCPAWKITVPAGGSSNGVDAAGRFNPGSMDPRTRTTVRKRHNIPEDAFVIGFIGRLVDGKGIKELETAWKKIRARNENVYLLTVGPPEAQDPVPEQVLRSLREDGRVIMLDYVPHEQMPELYTMLDVIAFPSYSEGLPNVPLEAAAMELPVVATRVTGCVDAIQDGVTGILVPVRDSRALEEGLRAYKDSPQLRSQHGKAARDRVLRDFRQEPVWEAVLLEYKQALERKGFRLRVPRGTRSTSVQTITGMES